MEKSLPLLANPQGRIRSTQQTSHAQGDGSLLDPQPRASGVSKLQERASQLSTTPVLEVAM